jgi:tetratricopeptide (TPR) repeat protein
VNNIRPNRSTVCHQLIISAVGALIYSNTLTYAFQFDDRLNIVDNPLIRDIGNLWPPSGARWFGLLTFALNYMAGGLNPVGYHLVNIGIHILSALSVYLFILLTFRTPYCKAHTDRSIPDGWLAFACALLFVAHPIQTQAITYIVQRFASLATLLFLMSLNCYILARLTVGDNDCDPTPGSARSKLPLVPLYVAAAFLGLLSMKTKENAYTLPVVAVMYDVMLISGPSSLLATIRKRWRVIVSLSGLTLAFLMVAGYRYGLLALIDRLKATNEISRHDYLITQFRVIVTYLRLLIFPVNQTLDHHYRVYSSVIQPEIVASLALIALLLVSALYLFKLSRQGSPYLRLMSFGIFWFFITLSVESSVIPIIDVMFEHRLYLPSIGAILCITAFIAYLLDKTEFNRSQLRRFAAGSLLIAVIALAFASHARNRVWKDELTLWTDVIAKTPRNPRGYNMVGNYYQANARVYDAIDYYRKALEVESSYAEARSNLGNAYIQIGRIDEGLNELMVTANNNRFDEIDTGILYYNIGKGLYRKGLNEPAIDNLMRALRYIPNEAAVYALLGEAYRQVGQTDQSAANFRRAHELDPAKY